MSYQYLVMLKTLNSKQHRLNQLYTRVLFASFQKQDLIPAVTEKIHCMLLQWGTPTPQLHK